MKTLRLIAASLLLISGILHVYLAFAGNTAFPFGVWLGGGILQLVTVVLLFMNKRLGYWLGLLAIVAPVIVPFVVDFKNLDWTFVVAPVEFIAAVCCLILLISKKK